MNGAHLISRARPVQGTARSFDLTRTELTRTDSPRYSRPEGVCASIVNMKVRVPTAVTVTGVCLLIVACSAGGSGSHGSAMPPTRRSSPSTTTGGGRPDPGVTAGCRESVVRAAPLDGDRSVLGEIAFANGFVAQPAPAGAGSPKRYFAKQGLLVRAGATVRVWVDPTAGVLLQYGMPGVATHVLTLVACPSAEGGGWSVYTGGYFVDAPLCVTMHVEAGGRTQSVRVAVGRSC